MARCTPCLLYTSRCVEETVFGSRGDIYIIDLKQTLYGLDAAYTCVSNLTRKGGTVLFVGTKKQAQDCLLYTSRCV